MQYSTAKIGNKILGIAYLYKIQISILKYVFYTWIKISHCLRIYQPYNTSIINFKVLSSHRDQVFYKNKSSHGLNWYTKIGYEKRILCFSNYFKSFK